MSAIMTSRKADAIASIERDRALLSDEAARARYEDATPDEARMTKAEQERYDRFLQRCA